MLDWALRKTIGEGEGGVDSEWGTDQKWPHVGPIKMDYTCYLFAGDNLLYIINNNTKCFDSLPLLLPVLWCCQAAMLWCCQAANKGNKITSLLRCMFPHDMFTQKISK